MEGSRQETVGTAISCPPARKPLPETTRERLFIDLDTGYFALETEVEEILAAMRQCLATTRT